MQIKSAYIIVLQMKQFEELQKNLGQNPYFANLSNLFNTSNINSTASFANVENQEYQNEEEPVNAKDFERKKNFDKLMNLSNDKLYEAAQGLYISSYQNMPKEKLVNIILDIFEQQKQREEYFSKDAEVVETVEKETENEEQNKDKQE
ncbi:UNVERIFIED_CONTAM: hypothetical protein O8I53_07790 [Campylobacter lari]